MIRHRYGRPALLAVLLAVIVLASFGCAKTLTPAHPGQINAFDGAAYDSLIVAQASLAQASQQVTADASLAQFKPQLNQVIAAYNTAQAAYKVYHSAGGTPTAETTATLQAQIADVVAQVSKLLSALGVKLK